MNETGTIEAQITPLLALLQNWGAGSDVLQAATNGCLLYQGVTTPAALAECDNPQISALSLDYGEYLTASQQKPAALAQLFLAGYRDPRLAILIAADLWCHQTLCRQPARASAQDPKSRRPIAYSSTMAPSPNAIDRSLHASTDPLVACQHAYSSMKYNGAIAGSSSRSSAMNARSEPASIHRMLAVSSFQSDSSVSR